MVRLPVRARDVSLLQSFQIGFGDRPASVGTGGFSTEAEQPTRDAGHLPPTGAEIKTSAAVPSVRNIHGQI